MVVCSLFGMFHNQYRDPPRCFCSSHSLFSIVTGGGEWGLYKQLPPPRLPSAFYLFCFVFKDRILILLGSPFCSFHPLLNFLIRSRPSPWDSLWVENEEPHTDCAHLYCTRLYTKYVCHILQLWTITVRSELLSCFYEDVWGSEPCSWWLLFFWAGKPSGSNHPSAEEKEGTHEAVHHCSGGQWGDIWDTSISVSLGDTGFCFSARKQGWQQGTSWVGGWGVFVVSTQLAHRLQCTITFISGWPVRKSGAVNERSTSGLKPESPPRVALQWAACLRTLFPSPLGAPWPSSRQRWWNTPQCGTASHTSPTWGKLVMKKPHLTGPCKHSLSLNSKLIW